MAAKHKISIALVVVAALALFAFSRSNRNEGPVYAGKSLREWSKDHPSKYYEAVRALGTNAVPYLLLEMQARDSAPRAWLQRAVSSVVSIGDIFVNSIHRHYYARLGFETLGIDAVNPLCSFIFTNSYSTIHPGEPNTHRAISILSSIDSEQAQALKEARVLAELQSPDPLQWMRACEIARMSGLGSTNLIHAIAAISDKGPILQNENSMVSHLAYLYFSDSKTNVALMTQCLVNGLQSTNPASRPTALRFLESVKARAIWFLPEIRTIHADLVAKTNGYNAHPARHQHLTNQLGAFIRSLESLDTNKIAKPLDL